MYGYPYRQPANPLEEYEDWLMEHRHHDDRGCLANAAGCLWRTVWKTSIVFVIFVIAYVILS